MVSMVEPGYRGIVTPGWVRDPLWARAQRVPTLDLRFAANRSLRDAVTGQSLVTFTRASSATVVGPTGLIETVANDVARFQHDPTTGACLGLLVEEQRANLLLNSATLSTQSVTSAATAYTLSFYGTGTITLSGTSTAGPLVGTGANQRVSLTFTPTAGTLTLTVSGSVTNANLEAGSFATSWIPTTGTSATRSADIATITGTAFSGWYNQPEGALYVAARYAGDNTLITGIASLDDNTTSNRLEYRHQSSAARYFVTTSGVSQSSLTAGSLPTVGTDYRVAGAYRLDNLAMTINGAVPTPDTSASVPTATQLTIGRLAGNTGTYNGTISRVTYWPRRLPDAALQALTT